MIQALDFLPTLRLHPASPRSARAAANSWPASSRAARSRSKPSVPQRGGNRRGTEGFERDRAARLEAGQELAAARAERGEAGWSLSVGRKSSACIIRRWRRKRAGGRPSWSKPAPEIGPYERMLNRC